MTLLVAIVFFLSLFVLLYSYILYPLFLWVAGRFMREKNYQDVMPPTVTIIIAAYNEEKYIHDKIDNALTQDYPRDKLQVIVVSDGSSDRTLEIANSFKDDRLTVLEVTDRKGKANALNHGLALATGEILVFTDANVFFDSSAIKTLVAPLADEHCGAVSGCVELVAMESGEPLGEGAYMKYERFIQKYESKMHTMVGVDGGMFAIRRKLVDGVPVNLVLDDFYLSTKALNENGRIIYEPNAIAKEVVPASVSQEFRRKTRIAAGGFQVLGHIEFLKKPFQNFYATVFFVSHKLLRWLSPFFMLALLISSALLAQTNEWVALFLGLQVFFYTLAIIGALLPATRNIMIIYLPYYFSAINAAFFIGFWKHILGTQKVTWSRVDR